MAGSWTAKLGCGKHHSPFFQGWNCIYCLREKIIELSKKEKLTIREKQDYDHALKKAKGWRNMTKKDYKRKSWMLKWDKLMEEKHPELAGKRDWDSATYHYICGVSPEQAIEKFEEAVKTNEQK